MSTLQDVNKRQQRRAAAEAATVVGAGGAEEEAHQMPEASASNANQEPIDEEAA